MKNLQTIFWRKLTQTESAARPIHQLAQGGPQTVPTRAYNRGMKTKTILSNPQTLQDLQDFLFDTMAPADLAVDWFCEQFDCSATEEVIDFVVEAHFSFFGE